MIRDYANMAANERTFLAWVRTGVAVIALGFVFERLNLFLSTMAAEVEGARGAALHHLAGPAGRYGGVLLVGAGVALIFVATIRFLHTALLLAEDALHAPRATHASLVVLSALVLAVAAFSVYLTIA